MQNRFAPELSPRPRLLAEHQLRMQVIDSLRTIPVADRLAIAQLFSQMMGQPVNAIEVFQHVECGIREARHSTMGWGGRDAVSIGYYDSERGFYTALFHEVGHYVLGRLGRSHQTYEVNPSPEEKFCWQFSRRLCRLMGLPYSPAKELFARLSGTLTERLREERDAITERLLWYVFVIDGLLTGLPYDPKVEFVWDEEGRPRLVVEE